MTEPRYSTDAETAPLLDDPSTTAHRADQDSRHEDLSSRVRSMTTLEKVFAGLAILMLLVASTFIGLFAGTQHQLSKVRNGHHEITTTTAYETVTATPTGGYPSPTDGDGRQRPFPRPTGKPGHHAENKTCLTKGCVLVAGEILGSMDDSVNPCDDFYEFANGGWLNSHSIPADRGAFGSFQVLADENKKIISDVLNGVSKLPVDRSHDSKEEREAGEENLTKLRTAYKACLDEDGLNAAGLKPLLPLVDTLTHLLGPFDVPGHYESLSDLEPADWEGAFSTGYEVPADLRLTQEDAAALFSKSSGRPATEVVSDVVTEPTQLDERDLPADQEKLSMYSNKKKMAMTEALSFTHSKGVDALLGFAVEGDAGGDDPQVQGLFFYQTLAGLPAKEYYEEKPIAELYTQVIADVLLALLHPDAKLGASQQETVDSDRMRMYELAKRVVKFERELWRAGGKPEELSNPKTSYNPYTVHRLAESLPFMDLDSYLSTFALRSFPQKVVVTHPPYLKAVNRILNETPDHVISAYFVTRMSVGYSTFLGPDTLVRKATRRLQEALSGIKPGTPEDRPYACQSFVDSPSGLGFLGGKEFVDRKFTGRSKDQAERVIYDIIDAFKARLKSIPWMDKESAEAAQKKAETLIVKIGYPKTPDVSSAVSLRNWYSRVQIDEDHFANGMRLREMAEMRSMQSLGRPRDRGSWEMEPQIVNAYYSPPDGEIVFPAGILQPPFFSVDWPLCLQYGAFGSVASHELTHAYDNTGRQYDERGRLRDWWTNSTVEAFEEKAECVVQQYSNYSITGPDGKPVYINGKLTNGEDLGDTGITFAYDAWRAAAKRDGVDIHEKLPGLDLTQEQLFFVASSRVWAQLIKPESALARIRTDPHSPNEWRSNGQLSGFKTFADVWQCKKGAKLNPSERCDVWG